MQNNNKIILQYGLRILVCGMCGVSYIFILMAAAVLVSGGEGSGEGMMGGLLGFLTSPAVIAGAWVLYPRKTFRIFLYCIALFGIAPFLLTAAAMIFQKSMQF